MNAFRRQAAVAAFAAVNVVGFASSAAAQIDPPRAMQNLVDLGEVAYMPNGIPASGPIDSPAEDADYIAFAQHFWVAIDTLDYSGLENHQWTAPALVDMETSIPGVEVDPWGGGLLLFEALYQHRLQPFDSTGPETIRDLIEVDPQVALLFKHWSLYHQVISISSWDRVAYDRHRDMLLEALTNGQTATVRGVPLVTGGRVVSDRLELEVPDAWFLALPPGNPIPQDDDAEEVPPADLQECIDNMAGALSDMPWKADSYGFLGFGGTPGFDCDDFADAMGAAMDMKPGVSASTVRMTWKTPPGANGGKGKAAHRITRVDAGGQYWLMDGDVEAVSGPHDAGTPMDGTPLLNGGPGGHYPHVPGTVRTSQGQRDLGDRPWSEPDPWYESRDMVECFEDQTGLDAGDFTPE